MTFTEFKEAGFTIQVTYDNTQFMQTDRKEINHDWH